MSFKMKTSKLAIILIIFIPINLILHMISFNIDLQYLLIYKIYDFLLFSTLLITLMKITYLTKVLRIVLI